MREFGFGAVDVLGMRLDWNNISITATQTTISAGGSTVALDGSFAGNGIFILLARGSGANRERRTRRPRSTAGWRS